MINIRTTRFLDNWHTIKRCEISGETVQSRAHSLVNCVGTFLNEEEVIRAMYPGDKQKKCSQFGYSQLGFCKTVGAVNLSLRFGERQGLHDKKRNQCIGLYEKNQLYSI